MVSKNLVSFYSVISPSPDVRLPTKYKICKTFVQAEAQSKLWEARGRTARVTFHPVASCYESDFYNYDTLIVDWGNPATCRMPKPQLLTSLLRHRVKQLELQKEFDCPVFYPESDYLEFAVNNMRMPR